MNCSILHKGLKLCLINAKDIFAWNNNLDLIQQELQF